MIPTGSFYLNSMDPGGVTGLSLMRIDKEVFSVVDQAAEPYDPDELRGPLGTLKKWRRERDDLPHVLVYEDFHIRPGQRIPDTTALSVISGIKTWVARSEGMTASHMLGVMGTLDRLEKSLTENPHPWGRGTLDIPVDLANLKVLKSLLGEISLQTGGGRPYDLVVSQEPVQAKHLVNDGVLKRLDMTPQGRDARHIRDAFRHAVTWLTSWGYLPMCRQAWPPLAGKNVRALRSVQ